MGKGGTGGSQRAGVTPAGLPPPGLLLQEGLGGPRKCVWGSGQRQPSDPFYPLFTPIAPQPPRGVPRSAPSPRQDPAPLHAGALHTPCVYLKFNFFLQFYALGSSSLLISWKYQQPPGRLLVINHSLQWLNPPQIIEDIALETWDPACKRTS